MRKLQQAKTKKMHCQKFAFCMTSFSFCEAREREAGRKRNYVYAAYYMNSGIHEICECRQKYNRNCHTCRISASYL